MSDPRLVYFMPLQKVIEARREAWGVAAAEQPDQSGEIMDYKKSKPHFWEWSKRVQKASKGKSLGNVRDSHTSKAVGKVIKLLFDDAARAVRVGVKILDAEAWEKVKEGVFTGFSIGGKYGQRWPDEINKGYIRYEAIPQELSLVDLPCIPGAVIELVKADGSHDILSKGVAMKEKFLVTLKKQLGNMSEEELAALAEELVDTLEEAGNGDESMSDEASAENNSRSEEAVEEQPKGLTANDVRSIVLEVLQELGLVERNNTGLALGAKIKGLAKSETMELRKSLEKIVGDVAQLAVMVEGMEKRGNSGPVLREIGTLSPQSSAALQKAEALKSALAGITDPLVRQNLQNEIARLEIQAVQQSH